MSKQFLVHQTAYFTFKVEAENPEEAEFKASQLGYEDAWESYADHVDMNEIVECNDDGEKINAKI